MVLLFCEKMIVRMNDILSQKKIILFDGVCNLCNFFVRLVLKNDKKDTFLYSSLSSDFSKKIIEELKIDTSKIDSIILYEKGVSYDVKSSAALKIMNDFGGLWYFTQIGYFLPKIVRDKIYDFVAKNRYKWFGKKDRCMIPSPQVTSKFLD